MEKERGRRVSPPPKRRRRICIRRCDEAASREAYRSYFFATHGVGVKTPIGRFVDINPLRDFRYSLRDRYLPAAIDMRCGARGIYIISSSTVGRTYRMSEANISNFRASENISTLRKQTFSQYTGVKRPKGRFVDINPLRDFRYSLRDRYLPVARKERK